MRALDIFSEQLWSFWWPNSLVSFAHILTFYSKPSAATENGSEEATCAQSTVHALALLVFNWNHNLSLTLTRNFVCVLFFVRILTFAG